MAHKVGRNEPCPCGSGKKYKHCCGHGAVLVVPDPDSPQGVILCATGWLNLHHRKAFESALQEEVIECLLSLVDDESEVVEVLKDIGLELDLWRRCEINFSEWLLAEGDIQIKGDLERISSLLLGPRGPAFTAGQRAWLEQLAQRPLRLYDVTEVVPGVSVTLCDVLDADLHPLVVDHSAERELRPGLQLGARVMTVAGRHQLSGALYPFGVLSGQVFRQRLRALAEVPLEPDDDPKLVMGREIMACWMEQFVAPDVPSELIDEETGEPMAFNTDRYEVHDWSGLAAALACEPGVTGDRASGWGWRDADKDGQGHPQIVIDREGEGDGARVAVFYPTAGLADRGRRWFDALAGDAVTFLHRQVTDPVTVFEEVAASQGAPETAGAQEAGDSAEPADSLDNAVQRKYAQWADKPLPALNDLAPRQAIATASGLERVKALLRLYQEEENRHAAQQGRTAMSYRLYWDELGLAGP